MTLKAFNLLRIILPGSLSVLLYLVNDYTSVQSEPIDSTAIQPVKQVEFNPPQASDEQEPSFENEGNPSGSEQGADRDGCLTINDVGLTPLIPEVYPITVQENPTFLFYVPYTANADKIEFVLQDSERNDIFREFFPIPERPGIIKINLSSDVSLQLNQEYRWFFKIYCDPQDESDFISRKGLLQRVAISDELERDLLANEERKYIAYAKHGIWYDAIANLAELYYREPENMQLQEDWRALLEHEYVNLSNLVEKDILDCCTAHHTTTPTN